jgi:hypothetical protein
MITSIRFGTVKRFKGEDLGEAVEKRLFKQPGFMTALSFADMFSIGQLIEGEMDRFALDNFRKIAPEHSEPTVFHLESADRLVANGEELEQIEKELANKEVEIRKDQPHGFRGTILRLFSPRITNAQQDVLNNWANRADVAYLD